MHPIGQVARVVGVEPHVLRHWEDVGVLVPSRAASGHRRYSDNQVEQARLVRRMQRAGLSLAEVAVLLTGSRQEREGVVAGRIEALTRSVEEARAAVAFLEHTRECRHRMVATCAECRAYAGAAQVAGR